LEPGFNGGEESHQPPGSGCQKNAPHSSAAFVLSTMTSGKMKTIAMPKIDLWYGRQQTFGHHGCPQRWVNILGRVSEQTPVQSLHYILNGGDARALSIGRDKRRLIARGDFNINLDLRDLHPGQNQLEIVAVGQSGVQVTEVVMIDFADGGCALPYTIDWNRTADIQAVAQVVDGHWSINNGTVSPEEIGYDRLLAIGDKAWRDYEVTAPITVHGINGGCYEFPSVHAGVGIVMRWQGHTDWGADLWASHQPRFGPSPYGAICWYCVYHHTGPELNFFDSDFRRPVRQPRKLALHVPYIFRARVETLIDGTSQFRMKVWEASQSEPANWDLSSPGTSKSLTEGSVLLVAHHVAASFGNVRITPL